MGALEESWAGHESLHAARASRVTQIGASRCCQSGDSAGWRQTTSCISSQCWELRRQMARGLRLLSAQLPYQPEPVLFFRSGSDDCIPLTCVKIPAGEGITCNAWGNGPRSPSYRSVHPLVHAVATFLTTEQFRTARRMRECLRRHDQPLRRSFRDSTPATCLVQKPRLQKAGLRPAPDGRRFSSSDVG